MPACSNTWAWVRFAVSCAKFASWMVLRDWVRFCAGGRSGCYRRREAVLDGAELALEGTDRARAESTAAMVALAPVTVSTFWSASVHVAAARSLPPPARAPQICRLPPTCDVAVGRQGDHRERRVVVKAAPAPMSALVAALNE